MAQDQLQRRRPTQLHRGGPGNQIVGVRDTKNREAGSLHVSAKTWTAFIGYVTTR